MTEVVFFHRLSRTAIFADLIQNFAPDWFHGWRGLSPGSTASWHPIPAHPANGALAFPIAGVHGQRSTWPIERVLFAQGEPASRDGRVFVRRAFAWLRGRAGAG